MKSIIRFLILVAVMTVAASSALLADGSKLAVGDVISVLVDGEKDMSKIYQLDRDGCVTLPMVDPVKVGGMNTSEAAAAITISLKKVLVNPQVTVAFNERAKMQVFVVGQVKTPGLVAVGVGDRVLQALAQAGYDETADLERISVRRGDKVIAVDLTKYLKGSDLTVNVELESQDTIVVPQLDVIGSVMVLGQVEKVGKVPLKRGMTFREALGLVGGVTVEADTDNISVKRESLPDPIKISYKPAMDGDPTADIALEPGDTIYVKQLETSFFTVMGAVGRPGQYPLKGRLSVSEAIGLAGGVIPKVTDMKKVTIMRGAEKDQPGATIEVNLQDVISKAAVDPPVQRGDVIYVKDKKEKMNILQALQAILPFGWLFRR